MHYMIKGSIFLTQNILYILVNHFWYCFIKLQRYDFKFPTKKGKISPEKPSPQKDKQTQHSGGGGPLND